MITTSQLGSQPQQKPRRLPSPEQQAKMLGLELHPEPCPKCGGPRWLKRAPCWLEKAGFKRAAKCLRCGLTRGVA